MSLPSEEKGSLEDLQSRLDQGTMANVRLKRSRLGNLEDDEKKAVWSDEIIDDFGESKESSSWRVVKKIFVGAIIFFVIAVAVAGLVVFKGGNIISNSNIDIKISGPVSVKAGSELNMGVAIVNRNSVALESSRITVEYPAGTRSSLDGAKELKRESIDLSTITAGEMVNKNFKALVFGGQGSIQTIKYGLEYRLAGSNNVFTKKVEYNFSISDSPLTLSVDLPTEMNSGREFSFVIKMVSNSPTILSDLMLDVTYPPGFQFKEADIAPTNDQHIWSLGDMASGVEKKITIQGVMSGQENENKSFRFVVGPSENGLDSRADFTYGDTLKNVVIRNPFVGANLVLNNKSDLEVAVEPGEKIFGYLEWANNLPTDLRNLKAEISISGEVVNRRSIDADEGFYQSQEDKIIWDKTTLANFANVVSGGRGSTNFSFSLLPLADLRGNAARNPQANLMMVITGERQTEGKQSDIVRTELHRTVKILSVAQLASQLLYHSGPFANSGPITPTVDQQTTYTVTWSLANPSNEVKNARIVSSLPNYVSWQATIMPLTEKISFNEATRQIVWDVGTLPAGLGYESAPKEVSFQIALTPSLSQIGTMPILVGEAKLTGTDSFANLDIVSSRSALRTSSVNESNLATDFGKVIE